MTPHQEEFLAAWAAAPRGQSAAETCRQLGLAPRAFLGFCAASREFRELYQELREHHGTGCAEVTARAPRKTPDEIGEGLERFLEIIAAQADAGGPINQSAAAREADISMGSVFRRRNPAYGSYDEEFAQRYFSILGANIIAAEDRAAFLATTSAADLEGQGEDGKMLTGVCGYLKIAPGSTHRDVQRLEHAGRVEHRHLHGHVRIQDLPQIAKAVGAIADRFPELAGVPDELDMLYDAPIEVEAEVTA